MAVTYLRQAIALSTGRRYGKSLFAFCTNLHCSSTLLVFLWYYIREKNRDIDSMLLVWLDWWPKKRHILHYTWISRRERARWLQVWKRWWSWLSCIGFVIGDCHELVSSLVTRDGGFGWHALVSSFVGCSCPYLGTMVLVEVAVVGRERDDAGPISCCRWLWNANWLRHTTDCRRLVLQKIPNMVSHKYGWKSPTIRRKITGYLYRHFSQHLGLSICVSVCLLDVSLSTLRWAGQKKIWA